MVATGLFPPLPCLPTELEPMPLNDGQVGREGASHEGGRKRACMRENTGARADGPVSNNVPIKVQRVGGPTSFSHREPRAEQVVRE